MTSIFIGNLTTEATEDDLRQLFGLDTTKYLRNNVRINIIFNSKGKYKTYAITDCPKHIFDELLKLNGEMTLDNKTLIIEPVCAKNIITPYKRKERSQGIHRQNQFPNSEYRGESRPASHAPSRQGRSVPSTNRVESEFGETDWEEVGGGKVQNTKSMARVVRDGISTQQLQEKRKRQLLIEIRNNDDGAPLPSAGMVYKTLTEQLGLSDDPSNGVEAIYKLNPSNPRKWFLLFKSEDLKNKFKGKEGTLTLIHKENKTKHTYYFKTWKSSVPAKSTKPLMITVQSTPLISNQELGSHLETFGKIEAIVDKKYDFAKHIDTGLRMIFITLNRDVKARDIPTSLRTSDGVRRKLFF